MQYASLPNSVQKDFKKLLTAPKHFVVIIENGAHPPTINKNFVGVGIGWITDKRHNITRRIRDHYKSWCERAARDLLSYGNDVRHIEGGRLTDIYDSTESLLLQLDSWVETLPDDPTFPQLREDVALIRASATLLLAAQRKA